MKKLDFGLGLVMLGLPQLPVLAAPEGGTGHRLLEDYGRSAVVFEQNVGQAPRETDFLGRGLFHALEIRTNGATLTRTTDSQPGIELTLLNANVNAPSFGLDRVAGHVNYMLGTDRSRWLLDVPVYHRVGYRQVWPGVNIVYYGTQSRLEFDLQVSPGADLSAIALQFSGVQGLRINVNGDLVLQTSQGPVEQRRPHVYQRRDGQVVDVEGHYVLGPQKTVRFAVGKYDRTRELVIDPVLIYGKSAASDRQSAVSVALDSLGNSYYVGQLRQVFADKSAQLVGYLSKLDPNGSAGSYSAITFGGRNQPTSATAVAIDGSNHIYIAGTTALDGYFSVGGGFQSHLAGGTDAYLLKLDPDLKAEYATYLGGSGNESAKGLAVEAGRIYVVGETVSHDFPASTGPAFHGNSTSMGFAAAFDPSADDGGRLWTILLGGSGTDSANSVVSRDGMVAIGGSTSSADFQPSSSIGFNPIKSNGSNLDGFVVVLSPEGRNPSYFTYWPYGPIQSIATEGSIIYTTGATNGNIPTTSNGYRLSPAGGSDAFVAKLNGAVGGMDSLLYSSYLGGSGDDAGYGISVGNQGYAYVVGRTSSSDFDTTADSISLPARHKGPYGFLTVLNTMASGAQGLVFSSLLSPHPKLGEAVHSSSANGVAVDRFGNVVVAATGAGEPSSAQHFAFADSSLPVAALSTTPGGGPSQSFNFTFNDPIGYTDIAGAGIVINSTLSGVNACYVLFARPDQISLVDDTGNPVAGHVTTTSLGAPAVLQNSQCVVLASQTTQVASGTQVQLTLTVVFKTAFAGAKNVWVNVNNNAGQTSGFQQLGSYTTTGPTRVLAATAVTPSAAAGQAQSFTFTYFDPFGAPDISGARLVFNSGFTLSNGCYLLFDATNNISLATDDGNALVGTAKLGRQTAFQNSQCIVYPGNSFQTQVGQTLTITVFVAFKPSFAGTKYIYSDVQNNAGERSAFPQLGTYTVGASTLLGVNSVTPSAAVGPSQLFNFVYADPNGYTDIASSLVIVNPTSSATNSCAITFNRAVGTIGLAADNGSSSSTARLGQAGVLQNSQCIVNAAASSQSGFGNYLTLSLFVTMKIGGVMNLYSSVTSNTTTPTDLAQAGTWTATSPPAITPVSTSPFTGATLSGSTQSFTFTLSDSAGSNDISGALIVLFPSLQGAGGCYILWGHNNNLLSLASDNALSFSSGTAGTAGLLSNGQCTVDTAQSFAVETGNTVNLTVAVTFNSVFEQFPQFYSWVNIETKGGQLSGWSLLSRFSILPLPSLLQPIAIPSVSVGQNLQTSITVSLQTLTSCPGVSSGCQPLGPGGALIVVDPKTQVPVVSATTAPADLPVSLASSDRTKVLLAGQATCPGPPGICGAQQVSLVIPAGPIPPSSLYVQGLANSGTATITASAPGFPTGRATITLTPSGFMLSAPGGTSSFTTEAGAPTTPLTVTAVRLDSSFAFAENQQLRGGYNDPIHGPFDDALGTKTGYPFANLSGPYTTSVVIASSAPTVGGALAPATFGGGDNIQIAQFKPDPANTGSTTLTAVTPAGFNTPLSGVLVTATVIPPQPTCSPVTVGRGLATMATCTLQGGVPTPAMPVTLTSTDPSKFLLAATSRNSTTCLDQGASSIIVNTVNASQQGANVLIPSFCVYGLTGTGTATYTVTVPGYVTGTGTVNLAPSGFVIAGPGGIGSPSFSPFGNTTTVVVSSALLDSALNFVAVQPLASGPAVSVNLTSSVLSIGTLSPATLQFTAGVSSSTTTFTSGAGGSSVLSAVAPPGFNTPAQSASVTAIVLVKSIALSCDTASGGTGTMIGFNLEVLCTLSVSNPAPAAGIAVNVTSNVPASLLLSTTATAAGTSTIAVNIPAGATSASFYAQSLVNSGTATYGVTAAGFASRTGTVGFAPSGVVLAGPFGPTSPIFFSNVSRGQLPIQVQPAALITDPAQCGSSGAPCYGSSQLLRGGSPLVQVTLGSTNTAIGLISTPVVITAGSASGTALFTPLTQGFVTISAVTPAGFTPSTNGMLLSTTVQP